MDDKTILDEDINDLDEESIQKTFDELTDSKESKSSKEKQNLFSSIAKGIQNTVGSIEISSSAIEFTANKIAEVSSKVGSTIVQSSKQLAENIKDVDYKKIGENIVETAGKTTEAIVDNTKKGYGVISDKAKEVVEQSKTIITQEQMESILSYCYDKSINGIPGVTKSVDQLADQYLKKAKSPELAAKALINNQLVKCTTSGFLTSLGGVLTLPVAIPANVGSVIYVQMRMIAAVAKIGGYDPTDDQVQTLIYACLTGQTVGEVLKSAGVKIGNKLAINSIQKISGATLTKINQKVGFRLITKFGETGVINLGKAVPVIGGIVGGGFDYVTTKVIAKNAYKAFILNDLS